MAACCLATAAWDKASLFRDLSLMRHPASGPLVFHWFRSSGPEIDKKPKQIAPRASQHSLLFRIPDLGRVEALAFKLGGPGLPQRGVPNEGVWHGVLVGWCVCVSVRAYK